MTVFNAKHYYTKISNSIKAVGVYYNVQKLENQMVNIIIYVLLNQKLLRVSREQEPILADAEQEGCLKFIIH